MGTNKAEEEGFEPSVPGTGTPVFETGPFNHSGTPPDNREKRPDSANPSFSRRVVSSQESTKSSPLLEEFCKDFAALCRQNPAGDLGPMIEARV